MTTLLVGLAAAPRASAEEAAPETESHLKLGKGIDFTSKDGKTRLNIRARLQLRFSQFSEEAGDAPNVSEFQARRIRLVVQGHARTDWQYYLQLAFSNLDTESDLRLPLRDAYITYAGVPEANIRAGQMKVPFGRQRVVSSSALQMVDRSLVVSELNLDRDAGVQLLSEDLLGTGGHLAYNLGVFSGDGRNRLASAPGVLAVARVAVRPFGKFDDFVEGDFDQTTKPRLSVAVAVAHNDNTNRERSTIGPTYELGRFSYNHATLDVMFKYAGLSLQSELIYRKASTHFNDTVDETGETVREYARDAWGYYAQGGYFTTRHLEVTARYGDLRPRDGTDPRLVRARELGAGASYYWDKHDLKLQADYFFLHGDSLDADRARHQIRLQLQLFM